MAPKYIHVPVTGRLYWTEIWYRDNTSNPQGSQTIKSTLKKVRTVKISRFNESIQETIESTKTSGSVGAEVGASYKVVSATVKADISLSKEITDGYSHTAGEQTDISEETTYTETQECQFVQ